MIGILVPEFPSQTHIFFWREIEALRRMGKGVRILSTRRPDPSACRHDFAGPAAEETHYVFPPRPSKVARVLGANPAGLARGLRYVGGLRESSLKKRAAGLGLLACAADLKAFADESGLRHIHVHSCGDAAHLAALCRELGGPPYSLTLHGDLPVYGTDHKSKMAGASFVSVVGSHLKRQVVEKVGLEPDRVRLSFMGVDTGHFRDEGRREYVAGRMHLLTVARLHRSKGHAHALAAMRTALDGGCDLRYTVIGEGPHREEVEREVGRRGLADRVELVGTRSESEVREALQTADALLLPSVGLGEAWPVSVMEAMACGLPVVSSIIGATPEMITPGVNGILVEPGDERGLAEAVVFLARDPEGRRRIGAAARRHAVESFDVGISARRLAEWIGSNAVVA